MPKVPPFQGTYEMSADDTQEQKETYSYRNLFRYLAFAKPYWPMVIVIMVCGIAKFTLPLILPYLTRIVVDDVIDNVGGRTDAARISLLWTLVAAMGGVILLETTAILLRGIFTVRTVTRVTFDLRRMLWRHLQRLSLSFHHSHPTGSILSRLMNDVGETQQMVNDGIINIVLDLACGSVALIILLNMSWELTLVVLGILPFYGILFWKASPPLREAAKEEKRHRSIMSGSAVERLSGIAIVQSFAQERAEAKQFEGHAAKYRDRMIHRGMLNQIIQAISQMLIRLAAACVWGLGAYLVVTQNRFTPGQLVQFVGTAGFLYLPIQRMSQVNIVVQESLASIDRVFEFFDTTPEIKAKKRPLEGRPSRGEIVFDNVQFTYDHEKACVLKGLDFTIRPGEKIAIVGESGAGKSTLAALIPRLYDVTGGAIRIDGHDVRDYRPRRLRQSIGVVLQEAILFSGTIYENLRYGRQDASWDEIVAAARMANAHEFIMDLPDGYESMLGERGMTLSGGQKQRLSLARTILLDPCILILDEATSALDSESENLIVEAMDRVMENRTSLIIAHRLTTILGADRIFAMRDGAICEQGSHVDLLAKDGYYAHLYNQQFRQLKELME